MEETGDECAVGGLELAGTGAGEDRGGGAGLGMHDFRLRVVRGGGRGDFRGGSATGFDWLPGGGDFRFAGRGVSGVIHVASLYAHARKS